MYFIGVQNETDSIFLFLFFYQTMIKLGVILNFLQSFRVCEKLTPSLFLADFDCVYSKAMNLYEFKSDVISWKALLFDNTLWHILDWWNKVKDFVVTSYLF